MTALEQALLAFVNGDFETRWIVARQLRDFGAEAVHPLIQLLAESSNDEELQCFIVDVIGAANHSDAMMALVQLFHQSQSEEVTLAIAKAFASFGTSYLDCLANCQDEPQLHLPVVQSLALIHHPNTISTLFDYIDSPDPEARAIAHEALGQFHQPDIMQQLLKALSDESAAVRIVAIKALGMRTPSERSPVLIDAIAPFLFDPNPKVCQQAAQALGRVSDAKAIEALWSRLVVEPESSPLAVVLVQSLGWSAQPQGVAYLLQILQIVSGQQSHPTLRSNWPPAFLKEVVRVLARVNQTPQSLVVMEVLLSLLTHEAGPLSQPDLQRSIIAAIAHLGQSGAIPTLVEHLRTADDGIRFHLIAALKQLDRLESYDYLRQRQSLPLDPQLAEGITVALREW